MGDQSKPRARAVHRRAHATREPANYLLLKADALQIPVAANSVDLVIATPPFRGEKRFRQREFCARSLAEYDTMTSRFLRESVRIVRPLGYILFSTATTRRPMPKTFDVYQKRKRKGRWVAAPVLREEHFVRHVSVENFFWYALPIQLYRELINRYSKPEDIVLHVFCGSGNGALAAIECRRKVILIDLCYHRLVKQRIERRIALADCR
jgi:DNA methylase